MSILGGSATAQDARTLIIEHHRLLQAWLVRADSEALAAFLAVHDPAFELHTVDERNLTLDQLHAELDSAGGGAPDLMIEITGIEVLAADGRQLRVTFVERHRFPDATSTRRVEATLRDGRWRRVVETAA